MSERTTKYDPGVPCWVDLMTTDVATANRFYAEVFGWEIEDQGEEFGHYGLASLNGATVAGIGPLMPGQSTPPAWTTYLATNSADASAAKAKDAGGTIQAPPMDVGDLGRMAVVQDPAGAFVGLWQAGTFIGAERVNEPGTLCWNEVHVRDAAAADEFYGALFGYEMPSMGGGMDYKMLNLGGRPVGGRMKDTDDMPELAPYWLCYFAVDDADAAADRIRSSGGTVASGPGDTPFGRMAQCLDPAGAGFAIIQLTNAAD